VGQDGSIKLNFPDLEVDEIPETCSLDVAELEGVNLEEVGELMNLTRERVRQIESKALAKVIESKAFEDAERGTVSASKLIRLHIRRV
jgi:DNA-directed RNA polymerase sigma subunit (sigma70/sigma32)